MHLWPWNSIANRILLRWRFAESLVNWNGTIQTLEHLQTNKQTDTETDADEISTASLRGGNEDTWAEQIKSHWGHGLWCPYDWPQCPSQNSPFWHWTFSVPFLHVDIPICAVIKESALQYSGLVLKKIMKYSGTLL